jgi:predicted DNA repair protein MutK
VVVALCRRCHTEHHGIQGVLGLDRAPAGLSGFEAVEVALRRAGLTLTRLDAMPEWVRRLGEALVRLADVVAAGVAALDHQYPDWRLAGRALPTGVECP